jgi:hypothetical protein
VKEKRGDGEEKRVIKRAFSTSITRAALMPGTTVFPPLVSRARTASDWHHHLTLKNHCPVKPSSTCTVTHNDHASLNPLIAGSLAPYEATRRAVKSIKIHSHALPNPPTGGARCFISHTLMVGLLRHVPCKFHFPHPDGRPHIRPVIRFHEDLHAETEMVEPENGSL